MVGRGAGRGEKGAELLSRWVRCQTYGPLYGLRARCNVCMGGFRWRCGACRKFRRVRLTPVLDKTHLDNLPPPLWPGGKTFSPAVRRSARR